MIKNILLYLILLVLLKGDVFLDFYKNIKKIKNPEDILVLVNKNNKLDKSFVPSDLLPISTDYAYDDKLVRLETKAAFESLAFSAIKNGYRIVAISTYRNYSYQEELYNHYVNEYGIEYADNCSARKGHSEHQTGLAIDVEGSNKDYMQFASSKEFVWMSKNAYKYGFILRYPEGKTYITGFKYEPWHYRYIGKDIAKEIYEKNITLEEYLDMKKNTN
jgi:D-alanyl-D-alanine carboxypeptidase